MGAEGIDFVGHGMKNLAVDDFSASVLT